MARILIVDDELRESSEAGVLAGYPVVDLKIRLYDGSYHEVDSNEMAFKMAASLAFKDGIQKGKPVLTEPIMKVEVIVPGEFLGDIIGHDQCPAWCDCRHGIPVLGQFMRSMQWCHWQSCSVMQPTCVLQLRGAEFLLWSLIITPRYRRA